MTDPVQDANYMLAEWATVARRYGYTITKERKDGGSDFQGRRWVNLTIHLQRPPKEVSP